MPLKFALGRKPERNLASPSSIYHSCI